MDTYINNGYLYLNGNGRLVSIIEAEEILQQAMIRLKIKLGSFIYNSKLGSKLYTLVSNSDNLDKKAFALISEALNDMTNVTISDVKITHINNNENIKLIIKLYINHSTHELEVII